MSRFLYPIEVKRCLSPHFSHRPAGLDSVRGGILHWTASNASAMATAQYLCRPTVEASCWMVVGKPGDIVLNVPLVKAAWHSGLARMDFNQDGDFNDPGEMAVNSSTFGIEVVGSYGGPWPNPQMYSVAWLIRRADRKCKNFGLRNISDHQAVALPHGRKVDVDKSFRCEAIFHWVDHPFTKLPCDQPNDNTPKATERFKVYKTLPLWARRNCDEIWRS